MAQHQTPHRPQKRSFVVIGAWLLAAFCLGSLLTGVRMSQTVAQYVATLPALQPTAHFNFLDDLAIYNVVALAGLVGLTLLALVGTLVHQIRALISRTP
ncbi:MAG: hypothetical protein H7Y32_01825 [Chloroflexales bacterium]|nr:hypothetical protein [Chloroflexales bacterium]